jgi:hypothetical protein
MTFRLFFTSALLASLAGADKRATVVSQCDVGYSVCNPVGVQTTVVPVVSDILGKLYTDMVLSLGPGDRVKREAGDMNFAALEGRGTIVSKPVCC